MGGRLNSYQKKCLYEKVSDSGWLNSDQIKRFYENIFRTHNVLAAARRFPQKKLTPYGERAQLHRITRLSISLAGLTCVFKLR